jgi:hypothetical protein
MSVEPLNLKGDLAAKPTARLTFQIIKNAIKLGADDILLEFDLALHLKAQAQYEALKKKHRRPNFFEAISQKKIKDYFRFWNANFRKLNNERMFFEMGKIPRALKVIFVIKGIREVTPSVSSFLFEDMIHILQDAAGIPRKLQGEISGFIETVKPISKWLIESKDLTQYIHLKCIRNAQ